MARDNIYHIRRDLFHAALNLSGRQMDRITLPSLISRMTKEVLSRRFARTQREEEGERWVVPDLILVDGGPQQLRFAREAMQAYGLDVPMFGLAERLEEIWLPDRTDSIILDRRSPALHLIQHIRDEAHRFAITYHRSLRGKSQVHSALEDIPGIGPARRRALLQYFGSVRKMKEASVEDLAKVQGMTRPAAATLYTALHGDP